MNRVRDSRRTVAALACGLALAGAGVAGDGIPKEFLNETLFGPTRIHGASGNGKVTFGLSDVGEITMLRWPNPSQWDQLAYRTAPGRKSREKDRFGAAPNQGLLLGVGFVADGKRRHVWLRDRPFVHAVKFAGEDSAVLVDRAEAVELGLVVEARWFAPPGHEVLAVEVQVQQRPGSPVSDLSLTLFENLAPTRVSFPYLPLYDSWVEDPDLLTWEARPQALVHRRARRDFWPFGKVRRVTTPEEMQGLVETDLRAEDSPQGGFLGLVPDPEGPVVAVGLDRPVTGWQCGPVSRWIPRGADAWRDAADGELSGRSEHKGRSTGALTVALSPSASGVDRVTGFFAFGRRVEDALGGLARAREAGGVALREATEAEWAGTMAGARFPSGIDAAERAVLKRTLISILQAQDPVSGCIVASPSTQPPYAQDWPRDGAFLDLVLDLAGFHDRVTHHKRFYAKVQRTEDRLMEVPGLAQPAGTFEMSYYADGRPGGPFVFEIDETALTVWGWVLHARFLEARRGRAAADAYLAEVAPAVRRAADGLAAWRDPETGLHKPAYEDDVPKTTQLLQGASTVHLAMDAALEAGARWGEDPARMEAWRVRRDELAGAIMRHLYREGEGFSKVQGPGAVGWMAWPCRVLGRDDPRLVAEVPYLWASMEDRLFGRGVGGAYEQKQWMAVASLVGDDPAWAERIRTSYRIFVDRMPSPGTLHFGETYVTTRDARGEVQYENRTSIPHVWAASLVYLSATMMHGGELEPPALAP